MPCLALGMHSRGSRALGDGGRFLRASAIAAFARSSSSLPSGDRPTMFLRGAGSGIRASLVFSFSAFRRFFSFFSTARRSARRCCSSSSAPRRASPSASASPACCDSSSATLASSVSCCRSSLSAASRLFNPSLAASSCLSRSARASASRRSASASWCAASSSALSSAFAFSSTPVTASRTSLHARYESSAPVLSFPANAAASDRRVGEDSTCCASNSAYASFVHRTVNTGTAAACIMACAASTGNFKRIADFVAAWMASGAALFTTSLCV
mmetsp:Transcript_23648/g.80635  ORF Transcript_23648/g.80635 Transcript_23648/m.80635 type:complete len:271 (-) Transcript_23648:942-1754(-)